VRRGRTRRDAQLARAARRGEINGDALDRFTIAHGAAGVLMGLGRVPWWGALVLAVGWELAERPLKRVIPRAFPHASQDSLANATCDVLAVMAGWGAMQLFPQIRPD
jgi:hypothetical protein